MAASLEPVLRDLLQRAFRASLHRLRGLRGLFSGWIEIGVPAGSEARVRLKIEEDMILLARLDWLGSMLHHVPPQARLQAGEAPAVLLAAALGLGTPEEAGEMLPRVLHPEAALAAAAWLQALAPGAELGEGIQLRWQGRSLLIEIAREQPADLEAWQAEFASAVLQRGPRTLILHPGAFALPTPSEHEA